MSDVLCMYVRTYVGQLWKCMDACTVGVKRVSVS